MKDFFRHGQKIVGVARNYPLHAKELNNVVPSSPVYFLKPTSSYVAQPSPILLRKDIGQVDFEVELGVVIRKHGRHIEKEHVMNFIEGYCLAIDVTARDLQRKAQKEGLPWCMAKGLDTFCPIGPFIPKSAITQDQLYEESIWLKQNGQLRQQGKLSSMLFKINDLIVDISKYMKLEEGDLILTGTPDGVGPFAIGDVLQAGIGHDFMKMEFKVAEKPLVNLKGPHEI